MFRYSLSVDEASDERLDKYVAIRVPALSRSKIQRLIESGYILVNGEVKKASYSPAVGDLIRVRVPPKRPDVPKAQDIPLDVVFEDDDLLVVNKPAGLVVHPGSGHPSGTLVNALLAYRPDIARADVNPQRPGIVHRLDADTSGLLVVAANREVQAALQAQFKAREVEKRYVALLHGHLTPAHAAIEAPIGRDPHDRKRMGVMREGRYARTEYTVKEHLGDFTLVEARPITGRTHQLRVHFASIGYPIVGDDKYGRRHEQIRVPRQLLHAQRLTFTHPRTEERLTFEVKLPPDFRSVLQSLRAGDEKGSS
ncbi:MAG: RluA family pseudouridine synthase [Chloroflexota bacterium]|nr:RluA family pseudouridine synthase [Chloroflexota bacterium]